MYSKEQFVATIQHEAHVINHLYSKVKPEMLAYRPTPAQRSMQELLDYLPMNGGPIARSLATGNWEAMKEMTEQVKNAVRKDFPATMQRSIDDFAALVKATPESELVSKDVNTPMGITVKLGQAFVEWNLKFLAAYRMQLFLYLKACGRSELNSMNLWGGQDAPMPNSPSH